MHRTARGLSLLTGRFPVEAEQEDVVPSCFNFRTVNRFPFQSLFSAMFFLCVCLLLVISLFKIAPQHNAEVLSSVPKLKRAVMSLGEKIQTNFARASVTVLLVVSSVHESTVHIK